MDAVLRNIFGLAQTPMQALPLPNRQQQRPRNATRAWNLQQATVIVELVGRLGVSTAALFTYGPKILWMCKQSPRKATLLCIAVLLSIYRLKSARQPWTARLMWIAAGLWLWVRQTSPIKQKLLNCPQWMSACYISRVIIPGSHSLNEIVRKWYLAKAPVEAEKSVSVRVIREYSEHDTQYVNTLVYDSESRCMIVWEDDTPFLITSHRALRLGINHSINVRCLGWSSKPVDDLLEKLQRDGHHQRVLRTYIPALPQRGNSGIWVERASRPCASLDSVRLDSDVKTRLIDSLNAYLVPSSKIWYSRCQIPYKKNHLFYGVADHDKITCATAIAGHYERDIYMLSLLDPQISDSVLLQLLRAVRPGAVVIIADIDSVPPRPFPFKADPAQQRVKQSGHDSEQSLEEADDVQDQGYAITVFDDGAADNPHNRATSHVSLPGICDATDGVPTPEGHIIIMTTKKFEGLDPQIIRPGRVDIKIDFGHEN